MKKVLAVVLAVLMITAVFAGCAKKDDSSNSNTSTGTQTETQKQDTNTTTNDTKKEDPAPAAAAPVEVQIMMIKNGDNSDAEIAQVQAAINERLAALGLNITAKLLFTAWNMEAQQQEMSTGASTVDIFPSGIGDSAIDFVLGAKEGQYLRLDNSGSDYLAQYGSGLFAGAPTSVKSVGTVNGKEGFGVYAYVIAKDINAQLGYLVNTTELEALGFKVSDIKPNDITSLEPIMAAYKAKYPDRYPLNCEPEVLARAATKTTYLDSTTGPLGYEFTDGGVASVVSRYETDAYKNFLNAMRGFSAAGYVDPDQQVAATAPDSYLKRLTGESCDWIISSAPSAGTAGQVGDTSANAQFVSAYNIMTNESVGAAALSVYAGSKHPAEAVQLLNAIVTDKDLGDLFTAGIPGTCYASTPQGLDVLTNTFRWWPWRYGILGNNSAATPWVAFDADGKEWANQKAANGEATELDSVGFIFDRSSVENSLTGVTNAISTYATQLGSGAGSQADYDAFVNDIKAAGIDKVIDAAQSQYSSWKSAK